MAKRILCRCLNFGACSWSNCHFNRRCGMPTKRLKSSFLSAMSGEGLAVIRVSKRLNACFINQKAKEMTEQQLIKMQLEFDKTHRRLGVIEDLVFEALYQGGKQDKKPAIQVDQLKTAAIDDMFDELNKVNRELASLKDYVKLLSKDIDALDFAVRRFTDKQPQDTMCKADVPQDVIKKPRTGTATTSDGIYFKDVNPDR